MDMDEYPTVKEQWDALTLLATPKTVHAQVNMHQSFLDMQFLKGGNIWEFLSSLKKQHHKLTVARGPLICDHHQAQFSHGEKLGKE